MIERNFVAILRQLPDSAGKPFTAGSQSSYRVGHLNLLTRYGPLDLPGTR